MKELIQKVEQWATEKGLIPGDPEKQFIKLVEEVGELAREILRNDREKAKVEIGDCFVVLIILARQLNGDTDNYSKLTRKIKVRFPMWLCFRNAFRSMSSIITHDDFNTNEVFSAFFWINELAVLLKLDPTDCLQSAYDKISKRTGVTENGVFIKSEDL